MHGSLLDTQSEQLKIHSRKIKQLEDDKLKMTTRIDELMNIGQLSNEQRNHVEGLQQKVQIIEKELEHLHLQQHDNSATEEQKRDGNAYCSIIKFNFL